MVGCQKMLIVEEVVANDAVRMVLSKGDVQMMLAQNVLFIKCCCERRWLTDVAEIMWLR